MPPAVAELLRGDVEYHRVGGPVGGVSGAGESRQRVEKNVDRGTVEPFEQTGRGRGEGR
jgi:hypothetical protein